MSALGRFAHLSRDPDPAKALAEARKAYEETQGEVVLINRSRLTSWADRKQLELLAEKAGVAKRKR